MAKAANLDGIDSDYKFITKTLGKAYFSITPFSNLEYPGKIPLIDYYHASYDESIKELWVGPTMGIISESELDFDRESFHTNISLKIAESLGWPTSEIGEYLVGNDGDLDVPGDRIHHHRASPSLDVEDDEYDRRHMEIYKNLLATAGVNDFANEQDIERKNILFAIRINSLSMTTPSIPQNFVTLSYNIHLNGHEPMVDRIIRAHTNTKIKDVEYLIRAKLGDYVDFPDRKMIFSIREAGIISNLNTEFTVNDFRQMQRTSRSQIELSVGFEPPIRPDNHADFYEDDDDYYDSDSYDYDGEELTTRDVLNYVASLNRQ